MNKDRNKVLALLFKRYYSESRTESYQRLSLKTGISMTALRALLEQLASAGMIKTGKEFSGKEQTLEAEWAKITKVGRDFCRAKGLGGLDV